MILRIVLVAVIYLLETSLLFAQERGSQIKNDSVMRISPAPLITNKTSNILAVKATVLPYFIGNDAGIATSVGFEYIFFKHHSIGIDGFLHVAYGSSDNILDTADVRHDVGSRHHSTEKAIFFNYRYYFNYKKLREQKGVTVYISPYFRYGYIERHNDPLFKVNYVFQKERSWSEGILLGMVGKIDECKRCKFDVNIGPFKKQKDITTVYLEDQIEKTRFEKKETVGLRIGVFFTYLIY
jgi:hypothetical protein